MISILLGLIIISIIFFCIYVLVDSHLVPAFSLLIHQYDIPEEVAAVTLIAFGSACPELLLNIVSSGANQSSLSQPAMIGSGMIAFGCIPSLCQFFSSSKVLNLKVIPLIRENSFYILSLIAFLFITRDGYTSVFETYIMIIIYVIYVSSVIGLPRTVQKDINDVNGNQNLLELGQQQPPQKMLSPQSIKSVKDEKETRNNNIFNNDSEDDCTLDNKGHANSNCFDSCLSRIHFWLVMNAIHEYGEYFITFIVPSLHSSTKLNSFDSKLVNATVDEREKLDSPRASPSRIGAVIICCMMELSIFVWCLLKCCTLILQDLPVNQSTLGGTLVAFGSQLPDITSSVILARNGLVDAAIAGAVGSQVITLTLGVALPAIARQITGGHEHLSVETTNSLGLLTLMVVLIICIYTGMTVPFRHMCNTHSIPKRTKFTRTGALCLFATFLVSYSIFIISNEVG